MALQKKSLKLLDHIREILNAYDSPLTLRQLYYQLVAQQIIPNDQSSYGKVSRLCVIGRDEGILAEDHFTDRLREIDKPRSWNDLPQFISAVKNAYQKDQWIDQENYIEIWSEKDALRNVFTDITYPYDVGLMIVRGQVSRTAIYESYNRYEEQLLIKGKKCHLFYFGDFDPSGLCIYKSLVDRLKNFDKQGEDAPQEVNMGGVIVSIKKTCVGEKIHFERIALTPEQIKKYNLPHDPAKKKDPNHKSFVQEYGDNVVELDALPPDILKELVEDCIKSHIDQSVLEHALKIEEAERERLITLIQGVDIANE